MHIEQIAEDISTVVGDAHASASTVFVADGEALLVDAMGSQADAQALRDYVENKLRKQVRFVIATHYFSDHLAGLRSFPDATIVAHELYAHTFATERHRSADENAFFVRPAATFSDRMTLRWGRSTLHLFHNPGCAMSAASIDVPEADLLFTANAIAGRVSYFAYSTPDLALQGIERLRQRGRGRILTGHGGPQNAIALDHASAYVKAVNAYAARCFAENRESALAGSHVEDFLPSDCTPTDIERQYHRRNLEYLAAEGRFLYA